MPHYRKQTIAHTECALEVGRADEKPRVTSGPMFDTVEELEEYNRKHFGHNSSKKSRGEEIDEELAAQDQETIERMEQAHKQREEAHKHKHKSDD